MSREKQRIASLSKKPEKNGAGESSFIYVLEWNYNGTTLKLEAPHLGELDDDEELGFFFLFAKMIEGRYGATREEIIRQRYPPIFEDSERFRRPEWRGTFG